MYDPTLSAMYARPIHVYGIWIQCTRHTIYVHWTDIRRHIYENVIKIRIFFFIACVSCALYVEKMVIWWKYIHWIFLRAIHNLRLRLCIGYDRQNSDSILHTVHNLPMYCTVRVHTHTHWARIEYETLQYSAQDIHSFALFSTPSLRNTKTAEVGKVICCINF